MEAGKRHLAGDTARSATTDGEQGYGRRNRTAVVSLINKSLQCAAHFAGDNRRIRCADSMLFCQVQHRSGQRIAVDLVQDGEAL